MRSRRKRLRYGESSTRLFLPDGSRIRGRVSLYRYPARDDGTPIREEGICLDEGDNLIVNVGRAALRALQSGQAVGGPGTQFSDLGTGGGGLDLGYLAVGGGDSSTDGSNNGTITPQPTDTTLQNELTDPVGGPPVSGVPRPQLSVSTPPPGPPFLTNLWSAQIGTTQLNGKFINEIGLYCLDDATLFSYRTFASQQKVSGFILEFRWSCFFVLLFAVSLLIPKGLDASPSTIDPPAFTCTASGSGVTSVSRSPKVGTYLR